MKWLVRILILIAVFISLIALIGSLLDEEHEVTRSIHLDYPVEVVWEVVKGYQEFPKWRADVMKTEKLADRDGHPVWREYYDGGDYLTLEVVEMTAPLRLVTRIADEKLPFSGTWTYALAPEKGGCRLKITERGKVHNPIFRFIAKVFVGHAATIENYLSELRKRLP